MTNFTKIDDATLQQVTGGANGWFDTARGYYDRLVDTLKKMRDNLGRP